MRPDLAIISQWIAPGSRVLDLGCGDGTLLVHLRQTRNVSGYGLEINDAKIVKCVANRVDVIQADLDAGLAHFFDANSFDYVVMSHTLQATHHPDRMLDEMLRVGKQGIVTFPNVGHWKNRLQLALHGVAPRSRAAPEEWYNTPNIRLCTLRDFEALCQEKGIDILERTVVDYAHRANVSSHFLPNLLGEIAIYRFCRGCSSP